VYVCIVDTFVCLCMCMYIHIGAGIGADEVDMDIHINRVDGYRCRCVHDIDADIHAYI
jgi:hypothetical protein